MSKYKPMLISFDNEGYKLELKKASEKSAILDVAIQWANSNGITLDNLTDDIQTFHESFCEYYTDRVYAANKNKLTLEIPKANLLDLLGVDITELRRLEAKYKAIEIQYQFNNGITFPVNKKPFERFTKSSEDNAKLRDYRAFVEALERLSRHTHIYPGQVQLATSSLVCYNLRTREYYPRM